MTAAHHRPGHGHDRHVVREAFEGRVAARPADAVEHDVALADGGDELLQAETGQEDAMLGGVEAQGGKGAVEPLAHALGDTVAMLRGDEDELAIADLLRDPRENLVELRQIFEQGLAAPIGDCRRPQAELLAARSSTASGRAAHNK